MNTLSFDDIDVRPVFSEAIFVHFIPGVTRCDTKQRDSLLCYIKMVLNLRVLLSDFEPIVFKTIGSNNSFAIIPWRVRTNDVNVIEFINFG